MSIISAGLKRDSTNFAMTYSRIPRAHKKWQAFSEESLSEKYEWKKIVEPIPEPSTFKSKVGEWVLHFYLKNSEYNKNTILYTECKYFT